MNRYLTRFVACLLIPAVIGADPVWAICKNISQTQALSLAPVFSSQASILSTDGDVDHRVIQALENIIQKPRDLSPLSRAFDGKIALITGASSGLGAALAELIARHGAAGVVLVARREALIAKLAQDLTQAEYPTLAIACDVTDAAGMADVVKKTLEHFGGLDILILNAGIGAPGKLTEVSLERLLAILATNIAGLLIPMKAALPALIQRQGRIGISGSVAGFVPLAGHLLYSVTKFAARGLADNLITEVNGSGVTVTHGIFGYFNSQLRQRTSEGDFDPGLIDPVPESEMMAVNDVAIKFAQAILSRKREVILPGYAKFGVFISRFLFWMTHWLVDRLATQYGTPTRPHTKEQGAA